MHIIPPLDTLTFLRTHYTADIQQHNYQPTAKTSLLHAKNRAKLLYFIHIGKFFCLFLHKVVHFNHHLLQNKVYKIDFSYHNSFFSLPIFALFASFVQFLCPPHPIAHIPLFTLPQLNSENSQSILKQDQPFSFLLTGICHSYVICMSFVCDSYVIRM